MRALPILRWPSGDRFSVVLLVLAGLFTLCLIDVAQVNLGMQVDSLVSFSVSPNLDTLIETFPSRIQRSTAPFSPWILGAESIRFRGLGGFLKRQFLGSWPEA